MTQTHLKMVASGFKSEGAVAPADAGPGTGFDQLLECLDVFRYEVDRTTVEEYEALDEGDVTFFTAAWQTIELALQVVGEYAQAVQIIEVLSAEARQAAEAAEQAADDAERTAAGLIVPRGTAKAITAGPSFEVIEGGQE